MNCIRIPCTLAFHEVCLYAKEARKLGVSDSTKITLTHLWICSCSHCTLHDQYSVNWVRFFSVLVCLKCISIFSVPWYSTRKRIVHSCMLVSSRFQISYECTLMAGKYWVQYFFTVLRACVNLSELLGNYIQFGQWPKTAYGICLNFCTMTGKKNKIRKICQTESVHALTVKFYLSFQQQSSLVPRPRPAFRRLQYGKAGRAWSSREHDVISKLRKFAELRGCVSRIFNRLHAQRSVWKTIASY